MRGAAWGGVLALAVISATAVRADGDALRIEATDAKGTPVPRATVAIGIRENGAAQPSRLRTLELVDGKATLPPGTLTGFESAGALAVEVYRARTADGTGLPLAPAFFESAIPPPGDVAVRLGPGRPIEGTAHDRTGAPLSSIDVIARLVTGGYQDPPDAASEEVRARAGVDANGAFVLQGLDDREVDLWLVERASGTLVSLAPTRVHGGDVGVAIVREVNPVATVRLVDGAGRPVAATQVTLSPEREEGTFRPPIAYSDENGVARFAGLDRRHTYWIEVGKPPRRDDLATAQRRGWDPREEARIVVPAGRHVDGVTVDASDAATKAWLHYRTPGSGVEYTEETAVDGAFHLRGMQAGPVELAATPVFAGDPTRSDIPEPLTWRAFPDDGSAIRVTIQASKPRAPRRRLSAHVVGPDGTEPARVVVAYGHGHTEQSTTASRGRATLEVPTDVGTGPAFLRACAAQDDRGAMLPWAPTRVEASPDATEVEIRMGDGLTIAGRVRDEAGRPMPGMTVVASDAGGFVPHRLAWAESGSDGAFRIDGVGPKEVELAIEATNETPSSAPVRAKGGATGVALVVRRASTASVRVVDAEGRPVAGAHFVVLKVFATPGESTATSVVLTDTPADGTVDVPPLDPTLHLSLKVEPPDDREDLATLEIDPWRATSGPVTMPKGFVATLTVVDDDGRPVKARLTRLLEPETPGIYIGGYAALSERPDEKGVVRIRGLDGPARFVAHPVAQSDLFPSDSPAVEVDEVHRSAEMRIPTKGVAMTVRAPGADPGSHVVLLVADRGALEPDARTWPFDASGRASIADLGRGRFEVRVLRKPGTTGPVGRVDLPAFAGGEVVVPTGLPAVLRVRPKAPAGATDVKGSVSVGDTRVGDLVAESDGAYACRELPAGRWRVLMFAKSGGRIYSGAAILETGKGVESGKDAEIVLRPQD